MDKIEQLRRIQNYATKYEVALELADGRRFLVLYTGRKSLKGLVAAVRQRAEDILATAGLPNTATYRMAKGTIIIETATVRFTGRTQRDAICEGRLDRLVDATPVAIAA